MKRHSFPRHKFGWRSRMAISLTFLVTFFSNAAFASTPISTEAELRAIQDNLAGSYELSNNLDLSQLTDASVAYIDGIFTGTFDGNGLQISGLNKPLFWQIGEAADSAQVSDITITTHVDGVQNDDPGTLARGVLANQITNTQITNVDVEGLLVVEPVLPQNGQRIGGLVGTAIDSQIIGSTSSVEVQATRSNDVGGLVGYVETSIIQSSSASGDVYGANGVGGLVGSLGNSTLRDSSATGDVAANNENTQMYPNYKVGGLLGSAAWSTIADTNASGNVVGKEYVGGLVGMSSYNTITNSTATGATVDGLNYVGGFIGWSSYDDILNSSASAAVTGERDVASFIGVNFVGRVRDSFSLGESPNGLFGRIIESDIANTYAFTLGNPESWGQYFEFAKQLVSNQLLKEVLLTSLDDNLISGRIGEPIKISFDLELGSKLRLWLINSLGQRIVVGDLEVIDGKAVLPSMTFSTPGKYEFELSNLEENQESKVTDLVTFVIEVE